MANEPIDFRKILTDIRTAIEQGCKDGVITDTLWMASPCHETVIDFIDAELAKVESDLLAVCTRIMSSSGMRNALDSDTYQALGEALAKAGVTVENLPPAPAPDLATENMRLTALNAELHRQIKRLESRLPHRDQSGWQP